MDERRVATKERRVLAKVTSPNARHATGPRRVTLMAPFPPTAPTPPAPGTPPRSLRPGEDGYVMGKTTFATGPADSPRPGDPYPAPAPTVQPQRPRADGTVPVKGDKDWIRYAGPDAS